MRYVACALYVLAALTMVGGLAAAYLAWSLLPVVAGVVGAGMVMVIASEADASAMWSGR